MAKASDVKTYARAIEWLEIFYQKLEVAVEINVKIEAQEVLHHLVQTVQQVCYNDMKTTMIWTKLTADEYTMTSAFSLKDVLDMTRNFTVELRLIVQRKRQTAAVEAAVHYHLNSMENQAAAIEDEEPEEGDEEDPTARGMGNAPKEGGTKKATPPRTSKVRAAYNSDKGCPDGGNCHMVKKKGHPFMKGKGLLHCLNCGSTSHLKAACNRPMASGQNIEAEYVEQREGADQDDTPDNPADESEQTEDDPNAAGMKGKGNSKGRGKDGKGRGKGAGRPTGRGRNPTPVPKRKAVPSISGAIVDGVYFEMMQVAHGDLHVASDSDVIDEEDPSRNWVQTLEDEHGVAYMSRGRKRCVICKETTGLMRRCNRCRHHVHGAIHGVYPHSIGGSCLLMTTNGDFLCTGASCGKKIPQGRIAADAAGVQRALAKQGSLRVPDMFPEACLAATQVVGRGQQGHVPTCSVPSCRSLRISPCQHFKCNGWWCNNHCNKIIMSDGRPIAVWCMNHEEIPVVISAPVGEQFMTPSHLPTCAKCGTYHEVVGCNYEGCSLGWCPSHGIYVSGLGGGFWCLRHKDNIPLEHEYSIIERPLGSARTYCMTCSTEVWPSANILNVSTIIVTITL
eukprot:6455550-Amphidinium_carterae.3